ncbi:NosD domain-containing protein [Methylocystis parvus]|uniref:NosD domain-containing protein n=1 Tax=Methylocystis parvus TaxID=134 RepID=UPI003C76DC3F
MRDKRMGANMFRSSFLVAAFLLLLPPTAQAALTRVWVSAQGVDAPTCGPLSAPCRQIKYALDNAIVAPGGEIDIRNSAGFAPFTIAQAVSIVNDGAGVASIQAAPGGSAVKVAAAASDGVLLKGLTIDGVGAGKNGLEILSAARIVISDFTIKNVTNGIVLSFGVASSQLNFSIRDSLIHKTTNGIFVSSNGTAFVAGEISHVAISDSDLGIFFLAGAKALLTDVSISEARTAGLFISNGTKPATVTLTKCSITNNEIGVDNEFKVFSYGDNAINGNISSDILNPASVTRVTPQ